MIPACDLMSLHGGMTCFICYPAGYKERYVPIAGAGKKNNKLIPLRNRKTGLSWTATDRKQFVLKETYCCFPSVCLYVLGDIKELES